jgi:hypothetical protein
MIRGLGRLLATLLVTATIPFAVADSSDLSLGQVIQKYDCQAAFPNELFTVNSLARPGSLLASIRSEKVGPYTFNFLATGANGLAIKQYVSSTTPLPTPIGGVDTTNYAITTSANANFTAEIKGILQAASFDATYLDNVTINITNVSFYHPGIDIISNMVMAGNAIPIVKQKILASPTAKVITATCVGTEEITFHFKEAINLTLGNTTNNNTPANVSLSNIITTFGFKAGWSSETGADGKSVTYKSTGPVTIGIVSDTAADYIVK